MCYSFSMLQGAVKKSAYGMKEPNGTPQRKNAKHDAKDQRSKYESDRDKEASTTHTTKERSQKDVKTRSSVREKIAVLKSESEKTGVSGNDVKQGRVRPRESQSSRRVMKETDKSIPSQTPPRNLVARDSTPRRKESGLATGVVTPRRKESGLASGDATPRRKESGLATGDATPRRKESGLATGVATPHRKESGLATGDETPRRKESGLATGDAAPHSTPVSHRTFRSK
jgi:hypothetical protein